MPVALAQAAAVLPTGEGWWYEPKFDGDRAQLARTEDTVRIYSRAGRDTTSTWMDIAVAGMRLPAGTLLDGEIVVWRDGRLDFGAVRSRASSSAARARELAARWPAAYAVWDLLHHPTLGPVAGRPYTERRALLLDLVDGRPPIQPVPATDDVETARLWFEVLRKQGIEGVVAKRGGAPYRAGRTSGWVKIRHADTVDAVVVGFVGRRARPGRVAVRLPDGRVVLSRAFGGPLAGQLAAVVGEMGERRFTDAHEPYTAVDGGVVVEVEAGTTRHATVSVTRIR